MIGGCGCGGDYGPMGSGGGHLGMLQGDSPHDQLQRMLSRCAIRGARFDVTLELTYAEIVDVRVALRSGGTPALATCVEEAAWDTPLIMPMALQHATQTFAFGG